jgi:Superfamily II DNA/RNA helicases, SNF2 family
MGMILHSSLINYNVKYDAFPYQREAFNSLKDLPFSAIFHEQGLGKTKIAIDLILYWLTQKDIDTVIVISKKQLVKNWVDEFAIHTYISPKVLTSNKVDNFFVLNSPIQVIISNFEILETEKDRLKLFLNSRNTAIVVDESTKIKNPNSNLTKAFFALAPLFKIRTIMTGTPVANRPYDIWSQIYFLDYGSSLGTDFNAFKKTCDLSNDLKDDEDKRSHFEDAVSSIFDKIKSFSVRETKDAGIISLPDKNYFSVWCSFEKRQQEMYEALKNEYQLLVQKGDSTLMDESEATLKRLLRLVQIASNPRLVDESYNAISAKEIELDHLINDIIERGEKVIVWTSFIYNVDYFFNKYKSLSPAKIHGKMTITERNRAVDFFKTGESNVLFATPQSAKEGLTLTIANNVIFFDRGFNLDDYLQAQDRIHRISQTRECNIYNLMVNESIDRWIDVLLQAKQNAASLAQGDTSISKFRANMDYSFGDIVKGILNID